MNYTEATYHRTMSVAIQRTEVEHMGTHRGKDSDEKAGGDGTGPQGGKRGTDDNTKGNPNDGRVK